MNLAPMKTNGDRWLKTLALSLVLGGSSSLISLPLAAASEPAAPPAITFATLLGGAGEEKAYDVAVDLQGNIYVTGKSSSHQVKGFAALQAENQGEYDAFVAKFDAAGQLLFFTFLGGRGNDCGYRIVVDPLQNIIVVGTTASDNFPLTNPAQKKFGGGDRDGFLAKFSADGMALVFSTYLGGNGSDDMAGLAMDAAGNIYVAGGTSSTNLPPSNLRLDRRGAYNPFVAKYDGRGALQYCSVLGGSGPRSCAVGLTVDPAGNAFITGYTSSPNFPTKNAFQTAKKGGYDAFVAKLDPSGSRLVFSTLLGGNKDDFGRSIALDKLGNIVVCGDTFSTDFAIAAPYQGMNVGGRDIFVARLSSTGSELLAFTYLGGSGEDMANLKLDDVGNIWLAGLTSSTNFPMVNPIQSVFGGGMWDGFVAKLDAGGARLLFSSYLGGNGNDQCLGLALDASGMVFIAGATASTNFPSVTAPVPEKQRGQTAAFIAKLDPSAKGAAGSPAKTPGVEQARNEEAVLVQPLPALPKPPAEAEVPTAALPSSTSKSLDFITNLLAMVPSKTATKGSPTALDTNAVEEIKAAELKTAEDTKAAAERKAAEEAKAAAEKQAAEEKIAAETRAAEVKLAAELKAAEEAKVVAEMQAAEEKIAAEKKAAEAKAVEEKVAAELKAAELKAAEEARAAHEAKIVAEMQAAEEKIAAEKKAAEAKAVEEKVAAELKAAGEAKAAAELKAAEETKVVAEKRAAEEKAAAEAKLAEEAKATAMTFLLGTNLIYNGDAEISKAGGNPMSAAPSGWVIEGHLRVLPYGTLGGFPTAANPGPTNRGMFFFAGGPEDAKSSGLQMIDVAAAATEIDAGRIHYTMSAWLGGMSGQRDAAQVKVTFLKSDDSPLKDFALGPVTLAERSYLTRLVERTAAGILPPGTRWVEIRLELTRQDGPSNDGYADNLSLVLTPVKTDNK